MVSVTIPFETETTLILSDSWLTTQASSLLCGFTFTETGSIPTGISTIREGLDGFDTSKTDTRLSGVFNANSREPSAERRIGLVWAPSKLTKAVNGTCASASGVTSVKPAAKTTPATKRDLIVPPYVH